VIPILRGLKQGVAEREDRVESLVEMTRHLTARLDAVLSAERRSGLDSGAWMIAGITLLASGALMLLGWLVSRRLRGVEEREREQFFFPDVLVGVRLGAQCGGGRVAVRSYGKKKSGGEQD
jgi:hypothetical protein